jgi:hypothetical protein
MMMGMNGFMIRNELRYHGQALGCVVGLYGFELCMLARFVKCYQA